MPDWVHAGQHGTCNQSQEKDIGSIGSDRIGWIGSDRIESDRIGSIGLDGIGSDRIGSDGSDRIGSKRIGPDRIGSDRIGSDRRNLRYEICNAVTYATKCVTLEFTL